jgi:hypothetical protein
VPCLIRKKLEASHGKLGDLVSRSVPSWFPDGTAELLDDVIGEVLEYVQGRNHLVIVEGFHRRPLAKNKDLLEHVNGGLTDPSSRGAASFRGSSSSSLSSSWTVNLSESTRPCHAKLVNVFQGLLSSN